MAENKLKEIALLREKIVEMLEKARTMLCTSFDGLMKNDIKILNQVLKDEGQLTAIYDNLTSLAIESAKKNLSGKLKKTVVDFVDIICAIERIGDFCVGLVERIEYKIRENLLFSEAAVEEYKELYIKIDESLSDTIKAVKSEDKDLAKRILKKKPILYALIEDSRANHIERSAKGICDEWAKIRYLDMLDFIKDIVDHCMEIAGKLTGK